MGHLAISGSLIIKPSATNFSEVYSFGASIGGHFEISISCGASLLKGHIAISGSLIVTNVIKVYSLGASIGGHFEASKVTSPSGTSLYFFSPVGFFSFFLSFFFSALSPSFF